MAEWEITQPIDYSQNGDDIDAFSLKTKHTLEQIYLCLQQLRNNRAQAGLDGEAVPYEIRIDTTTGRIYMRNANNTDWILLGKVAPFLGMTAGSSIFGANDPSVNHLKRLVGELYLALSIAGLDTTGHDSISMELFLNGQEKIDTTSVAVSTVLIGGTSIVVPSFEDLILGGNYKLVGGRYSQDVKITGMEIIDGSNYVTLAEPVQYAFPSNGTTLKRSTGTVQNGYITGDNVVFVTEPMPLTNKATGEGTTIATVHLNVKHQNFSGAEITADVALIHEPFFVRNELIGIGTGVAQQVTLLHTDRISNYGFKLYFNAVEQETGYTFSPQNGQVEFTAPNGTIVTADYYYNWGEENFLPMTKTGLYCDSGNNNRATTQFVYEAVDENETGTIAILRLKLNRASGRVTNYHLDTATGSAQGYKLPHHAEEDTILISSENAVWNWNDDLDVLVVTAPEGEDLYVTYSYRAKPFKIDSFTVMLNE